MHVAGVFVEMSTGIRSEKRYSRYGSGLSSSFHRLSLESEADRLFERTCARLGAVEDGGDGGGGGSGDESDSSGTHALSTHPMSIANEELLSITHDFNDMFREIKARQKDDVERTQVFYTHESIIRADLIVGNTFLEILRQLRKTLSPRGVELHELGTLLEGFIVKAHEQERSLHENHGKELRPFREKSKKERHARRASSDESDGMGGDGGDAGDGSDEVSGRDTVEGGGSDGVSEEETITERNLRDLERKRARKAGLDWDKAVEAISPLLDSPRSTTGVDV